MDKIYIKIGLIGIQTMLLIMQLAFDYTLLVIPIVLIMIVNLSIK